MTEAVSFCPHCGYDLVKSEPITDGRFSYSPVVGFCVDGKRLNAPPQVHIALGTVMLAAGSVVRPTIITERFGYEGDKPGNILNVRMTHARRAILALGVAFPIETIWGEGLRWNPNAEPSNTVRHRLEEADA